jgi:hypothetical protein
VAARHFGGEELLIPAGSTRPGTLKLENQRVGDAEEDAKQQLLDQLGLVLQRYLVTPVRRVAHEE